MYLLGIDIGSSSVKASLVNAETGKCAASAFYPKTEAEIIAVKPGWGHWYFIPNARTGVCRQESECVASCHYLVRFTGCAVWRKSISVVGRRTVLGTFAQFSGKLYCIKIGLGEGE